MTLRPWRRGDAPALERACGDDGICRFTTVPRTYTPAAALEWIDRHKLSAQAGTAYVFAIELVGNPLPVGAAWLFLLDDPDGTPVDYWRVGCWLLAPERRRMLAGVAVALLSEWAFERRLADSLFLEVDQSNAASRRAIQRLGASFDRQFQRTIGGVDVPFERYELRPDQLRPPACEPPFGTAAVG